MDLLIPRNMTPPSSSFNNNTFHNNILQSDFFSNNTTLNSNNNSNNYISNSTINFNKTFCGNYFSDLNTVLTLLRPSMTPIDRYFSIVWFIIGFPGNLFSFFVWVRRPMRPSSGCYLAALALNDFFFLLFFVFAELNTAWETGVLNYPVICELFPVVYYTFQYLSPFFILAFTVERYISICHPYQRDKYCTMKRNLIVISFLVLYTLLLHSWQVYNWQYDPESRQCNIRGFLNKTISNAFTWFSEIQAFAVVPLAITLLNIRVIVEIQRINKRANKQQRNLSHQLSGQTSNSATTVTLLLVSFFYIVSTLPVTFFFVMVPSLESCLPLHAIPSDPEWQYILNFWNVRVVVEELGASHYACNVIFYLLTGAQFRAESLVMLKKMCGGMNRSGFEDGRNRLLSCCGCCEKKERRGTVRESKKSYDPEFCKASLEHPERMSLHDWNCADRQNCSVSLSDKAIHMKNDEKVNGSRGSIKKRENENKTANKNEISTGNNNKINNANNIEIKNERKENFEDAESTGEGMKLDVKALEKSTNEVNEFDSKERKEELGKTGLNQQDFFAQKTDGVREKNGNRNGGEVEVIDGEGKGGSETENGESGYVVFENSEEIITIPLLSHK